jgi:hypothetical protein
LGFSTIGEVISGQRKLTFSSFKLSAYLVKEKISRETGMEALKLGALIGILIRVWVRPFVLTSSAF